jgi:hypothetical protein
MSFDLFTHSHQSLMLIYFSRQMLVISCRFVKASITDLSCRTKRSRG